jgi:hypothetical protein
MRRIIQLLPQTIEDLNYVNLIVAAEREISKNRHLTPPFWALRSAVYVCDYIYKSEKGC